MAKKVSPSIRLRFTGQAGDDKLIAAVCAQQSVAGNVPLAKRLINAGTLQEHKTGKTITTQGSADDDMYMIICGSVAVIINEQEMAVRSSGTHVGEMALLDSTAKRSATLVTRERTVLLKLSEAAITDIAKTYPGFWRRLAVELASRLRERTKFLREPNCVPMVFIGSSSEALAVAQLAQKSLSRHKLTCRLWAEGVFQLSQTTIEDLIRVAHECDFAVLFLTPDDMTSSRGHKKSVPRDNVVFELGLFMGAIGRERTFIVMRKGADLKRPTDLLGVTHIPYVHGSEGSLGVRLRPVTQALWRRIKELGSR